MSFQKAMHWLTCLPLWAKITASITGLFLLLATWSYVGSDEPTVLFLEDGMCYINFNEPLAFRQIHRIKWDGTKWVDFKSGEPVEINIISNSYGNATMRARSEAFKIAHDKPYVFIISISSSGEQTFKTTVFRRDNDWRFIDSEMSESMSQSDYMFYRFGLGE